jgi:hypothetical protein
MPWQGNKSNPAPNNVREPIDLSEKRIGDNRSLHVRRDTDGQKNITIGFYDIDEAIFTQLDRINLQLTDGGQVIKVPIYYASPELWTAARRDGYLRDKQGKIMLPVIVLKRTNSGDDESLKFFNRYLTSSVMKKYSTKNKYTKFSLLNGQNAPVNEVYNIVFPNHMKLTYHFIIWTEYVEQMNKLVEQIRFNTGDYWGSSKGFRFRTQVEGFAHTTELQVGEDRIVKTEFDLITHGYIIPETITTLETQKLTMEKIFTPKKFIVNTEVVSTNYDLTKFDKNQEKWRNPKYPNLPKNEYIPAPPISLITSGDTSLAANIIKTLQTAEELTKTNFPVTVTPYEGQIGVEGQMAADDRYFYIYSGGQWNRVAIVQSHVQLVPPPTNTESSGKDGQISYDKEYFYIYSGDKWRRVSINQFV